MGPIQRYPFGLLEMLSIKGTPVPSNLNETISPTFEMVDFYGQQSHQVTREVGGAGLIGAGIASTLSLTPFPKRMLAASGGIVIGAAAGTYLTMAIGYSFDPVVITNFVMLNSITVAPIIAGVYRVAASFERIIIPAQARIFCAINGNAAGADHVPTIEFSYQRLDQ